MVKTVNNVNPDESGNVNIEIPKGTWEDLQNKPFGIIGYGDTLEFNEYRSNETKYINLGSYTNSHGQTYNLTFYVRKVSDMILTMEDLSGNIKTDFCDIFIGEDGSVQDFTLYDVNCNIVQRDDGVIIIGHPYSGNQNEIHESVFIIPEEYKYPSGIYFLYEIGVYDGNYDGINGYWSNYVKKLKITDFNRFPIYKTIDLETLPVEEVIDVVSRPTLEQVRTELFGTTKNNESILEWDGDLGMPYTIMSDGRRGYRISDTVITLDDISNSYGAAVGLRVEWQGQEAYTVYSSIMVGEDEWSIHETDDGAVYIPVLDENGNVWYGIYCYPKNSTYPAGIYFCGQESTYQYGGLTYTDIEYVNYLEFGNGIKLNNLLNKEPILYSHLPKSLRFGDIPSENIIVWDGETSSLENIDETYFKVSDIVLTKEDLLDNTIIEYSYDKSGGLTVTDDNLPLNIYDFDENCIAIDIIDMSTGDWLPAVLIYTNYDYNTPGIYFAKNIGYDSYTTVHSLILRGDKKFDSIITKKIDKKYMPEIKPHWDNIIDRPFYEEYTDNLLKWDGETTNLYSFYDDTVGKTFYKLSNAIINKHYITGVSVGTKENGIETQGMMWFYKDRLEEKDDGAIVVPIRNTIYPERNMYIYFYLNNTVHPAGIYVSEGYDNTRISRIEIDSYYQDFNFTYLKKIDKKYLPDDIGGGAPDITGAKEGAFLRIVNGVAAWQSLPNVEEAKF